jgi:hypothetical protein
MLLIKRLIASVRLDTPTGMMAEPARRQLVTTDCGKLMAQAEALREAKPAIVIGPTTDDMRAARFEKLIAEQRGGSPAPGDAEKIRAIEVLIAQQKVNPGPVASGTAPPVHSVSPAPERIGDARARIVERGIMA